ncbi:MAG TPA: nucleotidyl transferase AbiEii/AbiGii toxin family protein [Intrasporangium sp.]|uniref:nucleotidyl transferase AbiEii/AbiGii toxin family protein n=1 Tax=Intrasporangium sp. TaxID=1925024 RepID=UPI002D76A291|nr:nucleotidyl transferase AbiEii/AbiGii toxin family protein [Intrasporangium sp.]HET7398150.1 nucleotidyl transferase AbiEii/AbiGii toxin family protein [Intrasporangium sp.]
MTEPEHYPSASGVEAAIKDAAKKATAADPALSVNERIRLEYFNRFLSRVFSEGADSEWLFKGGAGMLARVPSTRATLDIDLYRDRFTLDQPLAELRRLATSDLGDHFRFQYAGHDTSVGGEAQPYTEGYVVTFDVFIGPRSKGTLHVDLAVGVGATAPVTTANPANALHLPRLVHHAYRLYPIVDQMADKVCATMQTYRGRASSREKDLVDLVVLAVTQNVDGTALAIAISTETHRRLMEPFDHFVVPGEWGRRYAQLARPVPYCADYPTVEVARELVTRVIDPALDGRAAGKTWSPGRRSWA